MTREYPERPVVGVGGVVYVTRAEAVALGVAAPERGVVLVKRGHQPLAGEWSLPGGTLEIGETLEAAVAREVAEESGVTVGAVRYAASQPWPFPGSLMLGFEADLVAGDPAPRDGELEDARWFHRDEVAEAARDDVEFFGEPGEPGRLLLPPRLAIARTLVERWLAVG